MGINGVPAAGQGKTLREPLGAHGGRAPEPERQQTETDLKFAASARRGGRVNLANQAPTAQ